MNELRGKAPDMTPITEVADAAIDQIDATLAEYYEASAPRPRNPYGSIALFSYGGVQPSAHELGRFDDLPAPDAGPEHVRGIREVVQRLIGGNAFRGTFMGGGGRTERFLGGIEEDLSGDSTEEE